MRFVMCLSTNSGNLMVSMIEFECQRLFGHVSLKCYVNAQLLFFKGPGWTEAANLRAWLNVRELHSRPCCPNECWGGGGRGVQREGWMRNTKG